MAIDTIGRKKINDTALRKAHSILVTTKRGTKNKTLKKKINKSNIGCTRSSSNKYKTGESVV